MRRLRSVWVSVGGISSGCSGERAGSNNNSRSVNAIA